jgi:hypothetical protein
MTAIAATGAFPYKHRTIAEIDADVEWQTLLNRKIANRGPHGGDWIDRTVGISFDGARETAGRGIRVTLPSMPCPNCGARGWCGHGDRIAA